jgi:hypothetical protein
MKIFLSWAGNVSQAVAVTLRKHLPLMIQRLEVFMSKHDIGSGSRWGEELTSQLDATSFGVFCLTPESLASPWVQFEAGAITKHGNGRACGLLIGSLLASDVVGPLALFQHRTFNRNEFLHLLKDINSSLEKPLPSEAVETVLSKWWDEIQSDYQAALSLPATLPPPSRAPQELLEEILVRLRNLELQSKPSSPSPKKITGDVLSRPTTYDSLAWYTVWKFPGLQVSEPVHAILLQDLDLARYPIIESIDNVVNAAHAAVEAYKSENPEWFEYGTDFITKSLGFIDTEFRARHGFAGRTRVAFEKYRHLVASA